MNMSNFTKDDIFNIYRAADTFPLLDGRASTCFAMEKLYEVMLHKWGLLDVAEFGIFYDKDTHSFDEELSSNRGNYSLCSDDCFDRYLMGGGCLYDSLFDNAFKKAGLGESGTGGRIYHEFLSDDSNDSDAIQEYLDNHPEKEIVSDALRIGDADLFLDACEELPGVVFSALDIEYHSDINVSFLRSPYIGKFLESDALLKHSDDPLVEQIYKLINRIRDPFYAGYYYDGVKNGVWYDVILSGIVDECSQEIYGLNHLGPEWYPGCFLLKMYLDEYFSKYKEVSAYGTAV